MKNFRKNNVLIFMLLVISVFMMNFSIVSAANVTLKEIAEKFNSCSTVKSYKDYGYEYGATVSDNKLIIEMKGEGFSSITEYTLNDSILSINASEEDAFSKLMSVIIVTDCVGQIHGYKDGELFDTLNSEKISEYTVENEGFEIKELKDGGYEIKIDIDKKLPLVDLSDAYIKVSDLDDFIKDILTSDEYGSVNTISRPFAYSASVDEDGEVIIYFGEKDGTTARTYNSILSFIKMLFESEEVLNYFKTNYPEISEGNKSFDGFEIITNIPDEELENINFAEEYSVIKIVIQKKVIRASILNEPVDDNKDNNNDYIWSNADEWALEELTKAIDAGLIPETFNEKDFTGAITRMDFAAVAVKLYEAISGHEAERASNNPFTDTNDDYVLKAYELGITFGTSETTFTPDSEITREQMATMMTRALTKVGINTEIDITNISKFEDDSDLNDWGRPSVYFMASQEIIKGIGDNKFNGLGNAKIEEAVVIALRSTDVFKK